MDRTDDEFLKVNANIDYTAYKLAEFLRNCMRAAAAGDNRSQIYHASDNFMAVLKLLQFSEGMNAYELVSKAIGNLEPEEDRSAAITATVRAAQMGMRYLVEKSCDDPAARGRASRREDEFLAAFRRIEAARDRANREWEARRKK